MNSFCRPKQQEQSTAHRKNYVYTRKGNYGFYGNVLFSSKLRLLFSWPKWRSLGSFEWKCTGNLALVGHFDRPFRSIDFRYVRQRKSRHDVRIPSFHNDARNFFFPLLSPNSNCKLAGWWLAKRFFYVCCYFFNLHFSALHSFWIFTSTARLGERMSNFNVRLSTISYAAKPHSRIRRFTLFTRDDRREEKESAKSGETFLTQLSANKSLIIIRFRFFFATVELKLEKIELLHIHWWWCAWVDRRLMIYFWNRFIGLGCIRFYFYHFYYKLTQLS